MALLPSPDAVAAVKAFILAQPNGFTNTDAALLSAMNTPSVANPVPQGTIRQPWTIDQLFGMVSAASLGNIARLPFVGNVRDDLNNQDYDKVEDWARISAAAQAISPTELETILTNLSATIPDPAWLPQLSWASVNLGRPAQTEDIAAARTANGG